MILLTSLFCTEEFFNGLLIILCTIGYQILKQQQHLNAFASAVGQIIQGIPAVEPKNKIIIKLGSEIIFHIIHTNPINMRHLYPLLLQCCTNAPGSPRNNSLPEHETAVSHSTVPGIRKINPGKRES